MSASSWVIKNCSSFVVVAIPFSPRSLRQKSQYSEYLSVFSPNAGKCRKMRTRITPNTNSFTQRMFVTSYYNWHKLFYSLNFLHRNRLFTPPLKTSKLSLKVLFFKAAPQSDGLICAGHLMEKIPFNQPRSSLWQSFTGCSIHVQFSHIESPWCFLPIWHFLIKYILLSLQMYLVNSYEDVTKKSLHQLWFYEPVLAFLKLRKSPSTSLNLIFWA